LPNINPDTLNLPDGIMTRPSIVAVFDAIAQEIILTTTVRPQAGVSAKTAHDQARARIETVIADLHRPLAHDAPRAPRGPMD
ncbi:hypothetical protein NK936_24220, partial [Salmonella enterica subsp. enterica serovar Typhimurium]